MVDLTSVDKLPLAVLVPVNPVEINPSNIVVKPSLIQMNTQNKKTTLTPSSNSRKRRRNSECLKTVHSK